MPDPVIIMNRPFWARIFTAVWVIEVFAGLGFAAGGIGMLGAHETGVAAVLIISGLLLAVVGVVMVGITARAARLNGPAIEMRHEGFLDRRIAAQQSPGRRSAGESSSTAAPTACNSMWRKISARRFGYIGRKLPWAASTACSTIPNSRY